jgi:hypothetical protein
METKVEKKTTSLYNGSQRVLKSLLEHNRTAASQEYWKETRRDYGKNNGKNRLSGKSQRICISGF